MDDARTEVWRHGGMDGWLDHLINRYVDRKIHIPTNRQAGQETGKPALRLTDRSIS